MASFSIIPSYIIFLLLSFSPTFSGVRPSYPSRMAMVAKRSWLSEIGIRVGLKRSLTSDTKKNNHNKQQQHQHQSEPTLGILSFETARTMSRLLSLYKSLSNEELNKLCKEIMKSEGVCFLNSKDEGFLLNLACAERIEDLDRCAIAVACLGKKCSDPALFTFEEVYADLKSGLVDIAKLEFVSKEVENNIDRMEKLISATSSLYSELEALYELESSDRKLNQWKHDIETSQKVNTDLFDSKLAAQRQLVGRHTEMSLWSQTFDKAIGLMARTICIIYGRICVVFGPYISGLPYVSTRKADFHSGPIQIPQSPNLPNKPRTKSGPIGKQSKRDLIRFWSRESNPINDSAVETGFDFGFGVGFKKNYNYLFGGDGKKSKLIEVAPPSTLGGSGLTFRYANVIIVVERYLKSPCSVGDYERDNLYRMLPTSLKMSVRSKLRKSWRKGEVEDQSLAEGWRDALKGIMGWLSPMAHDTVKWQAERNFERENFEARPTVLLLQTLHFSDREKAEAAIAEILVGLSCIFRHENRYFGSSSGSEDEFR